MSEDKLDRLAQKVKEALKNVNLSEDYTSDIAIKLHLTNGFASKRVDITVTV